jgi:hypothetical protein
MEIARYIHGFHLRTDAKAANVIEDYSSIFRTQLVFGVW